MNILMVHPHDIYSDSEPWTVRITYIAEEFVKKGHNVKLVYFPLDREERRPENLSAGVVVIPFRRRHGAGVLLSNIVRLYTMAEWADVIHFQKCFYHASAPAITAAFLRRKPLHYDWDDWETKIYEVSTEPGILRSFIRSFLNFLECVIPRIADTVSVASKGLKKECLKSGVAEKRIFSAHVGADIVRFNPGISGKAVRSRYGIDKPLALYLGQLHGGQYAGLFIETAAKLINENRKDLAFMIVGDGYQAEELKGLTRKLGLDGRVVFAGAVPHEKVPDYIAAADVCVACFEDNEVTRCKSPLKVVEYMACGKAIVASSVGEVPQMVADAGLLCPPSDSSSLASAVARILDDSKLKKALETSARKRTELKYNWSVTSENLLRAYNKAIEINRKTS